MTFSKSNNYLIEKIELYNSYCRDSYNIEALDYLYNYYTNISKLSIKKIFSDLDNDFIDAFEELSTYKNILKRNRKRNIILVKNRKLLLEIEELFHTNSSDETFRSN